MKPVYSGRFFFMSKEEKVAIAAATDGACSGNPGPGGWGALIRFQDGSEVEFGGNSPETTNNRMELKAALFVLEKLKNIKFDPSLTLKTDSKYFICLLYTSPSPRDGLLSRMPSSA